MSVLKSLESPSGRMSTLGRKFEWSHSRAWTVLTSTSSDDGYVVINDGISASPDPLPFLYELHPTDGASYCISITATPDGGADGKGWNVSASYTNVIDPRENEENPLDRPPQVTWSFAQFQTFAEQDKDEITITNTVAQPFDPPVEKDASNIILNFTRFEASYSPTLAIQYQDSINSGNFLGAPPYTAKVQAITATQHYENGTLYWETTYEIHFRRETWIKKILNRGTNYIDGSGAIKEVTDREPRNLDQNGHLIPKGSTFGIYYVEKHVYAENDFDNLNIVLP